MTKKTSAAPRKVTLLSSAALTHVRHAATGIARQDAATEATRAQAKADMISAGIKDAKKQPMLRDAFYASYMAARENSGAVEITDAMVAEGTRLLAAGNAGSSKPDRRTLAQDTAYTAARVAWTRMLQACAAVSTNAKATSNRAPAGQTGKAAEAPAEVSKPAVAVCTSAKDAHAYMTQQASTMLLYCNKNAAKVPAALKSAVMDFREAIKGWTPND